MKKFSVLAVVFVLFAASAVIAQDQASPSDAPAATNVVQPAVVVQEAAQDAPADQSVVMMPVEGQAPMAGSVVSNGCCGSTVVQQPCCGQAQPSCCPSPCRRGFVRRPFFRRGWFRRGCCN